MLGAFKMNPVMDSINSVVGKSKHVRIDYAKLEEFAASFNRDDVVHWTAQSPVDLSSLDIVRKTAFLFVFNSISFSYWGGSSWKAMYGGRYLDRGSWSMIACLKRAIDDGVPIMDPCYLSKMGRDDLARILQGNVKIPLLDDRLRILNGIGSVISERYGGSFDYLVNQAEDDALRFVDIITTFIPSFNDSSVYRGFQVHFHKRAQLLAADLHKEGLLHENSDQLTACADYILPMVARYAGIIVYSSELASLVDRKISLPAGSALEVEIRMNTVKMISEIADRVFLSPMDVNDYFWLRAPKIPDDVEYHRTRTTAY